jgi:hypothetical protein
LLRESRSWRYSRRKILRPDEFSGLGRDGSVVKKYIEKREDSRRIK